MKQYLIKLFKEKNKDLLVTINDTKTLGEEVYEDPCCVFGEMPLRYCEFKNKKWNLPPLSEMRKSKKKNVEKKKEVIELFETISTQENFNKKPTVKHKAYVDMNNTKVGSSDICDIKIDKKEIEYLNKIKSFLGGGKIVLKKGNTVIEVD
jgi:hypothetical protein